jgi:arabinogalactan endo-1,4-beta-galactosidase
MLTTKQLISVLFVCSILFSPVYGQEFIFGADLSYVNEMEDCGVIYKEDGNPKDPYQIFADHNCKAVRLRLWHTPEWYDNLNDGNRYSDYADVKRSIQRAKDAGMQVLLDFHLSDNWADPSKQLVPLAWLDVVDNLPVLKDSLYNYISKTLLDLNAENLLPEMVQIGNETNKGILLSPEDNAVWTLDWDRNSELFNRAIEAVRAVETSTGKTIKIGLHMAAPEESTWLLEGFLNNGVTDFDIIGMSYYWAWHKPTSIAKTGEIVAEFKSAHPDKEVMIFETGYLWTNESNDAANNIISELHPDYSPASPENQRDWLIDLTAEVMASGGSGVFYWEPAWVSSSCYTQWGQGSHQEHATFFDFDSNLLENGGMDWMTHNYATSTKSEKLELSVKLFLDESHRVLNIVYAGEELDSALSIQLLDTAGKVLLSQEINSNLSEIQLTLPDLPYGTYVVSLNSSSGRYYSEKIAILQED